MPMSSLAKMIIRRAMKRASSPASSILRQVVDRGLRIAAAHALDERTDHVVVIVTAVAQRAGAQRRLDVVELDRVRDRPARKPPRAPSAPVGHRHLPGRRAARSPRRSRSCLPPASPRRTSASMASRSSGSRRNSVLRLRSGGLTSKNGFSVVAPIIVNVPSSTAGSRRVLLGLAEPVDLVEEQDRAATVLAECAGGPAR